MVSDVAFIARLAGSGSSQYFLDLNWFNCNWKSNASHPSAADSNIANPSASAPIAFSWPIYFKLPGLLFLWLGFSDALPWAIFSSSVL